ncbi:MAG: hypothetical protein IJO32_05285 [Bacilli bacterium]|nr:hypothetical protein [Bacilli bacterium]
MCLELQILCDRYNEVKEKNPNLYIYDEVVTLKYENIHKNGLGLDLKVIKVEDSYKIFFMVSKLDKLILVQLVEESKEDITNKFDSIFDDLSNMSIDMFLKKYFEV